MKNKEEIEKRIKELEKLQENSHMFSQFQWAENNGELLGLKWVLEE